MGVRHLEKPFQYAVVPFVVGLHAQRRCPDEKRNGKMRQINVAILAKNVSQQDVDVSHLRIVHERADEAAAGPEHARGLI